MENKKIITVEASMENLDKVTSFVEAFLDDYACPMKIAMKILLCVEELYANVVNYAYGSRGGNCTIELEGNAYETEHKVCIRVRDQGVPFDPFAKEDPDITLSADEREIGGLGIYMVKNIMDTVSYEYKQQENIVTMIKKWQI